MNSNADAFKTYLFRYEHAGASWVQEIRASDAADAQARVRKLYAATLDGEMVAKLTAPGVSWRSVALRLRRLIFGP
jgi:hypothetical protein